MIKHYSEDISHALNDFGLLPRFKYPRENQSLNLTAFKNRSNEDFVISDEKIRAFKDHPDLKIWKLRLNKFRKDFFRLKFPGSLPLGHQQKIYAVKT